MSATKTNLPWLRPELVASWPEIIAVLIFVIGVPAYTSAQGALHGSVSYFPRSFQSNSWLFGNSVWQVSMLALTLGFLHWRGWTAADFKIKANWRSSLHSVILWFVMNLGYGFMLFSVEAVMFLFFRSLVISHGFFGLPAKHFNLHDQSPNLVLAFSSDVLNAYWEELTCMGYAFTQFATKRGPLFALLLTVVLRMSCHSYQGLIHMLAVGVMFAIGGAYYWRSRNLWPLILAHIIFNMVHLNVVMLALKLVLRK